MREWRSCSTLKLQMEVQSCSASKNNPRETLAIRLHFSARKYHTQLEYENDGGMSRDEQCTYSEIFEVE